MSSRSASSTSISSLLDGAPHFVWKNGDAEVAVLGTAHISSHSVEDVKRLFAQFKPDIVAVELCQSRFEALSNPHRWQNLDMSQIIREKKIWLLFSSLMLSAIQKKMGAGGSQQPGAEMLTATQLAQAGGAELLLADRDVRITLRRAWNRVGFFSRLWMISSLFTALLVREKIAEEEIERLKQQDILEEMLQMLPRRYEPLREVILAERDAYIAEKICQRVQKESHSKSSRKSSDKSSGESDSESSSRSYSESPSEPSSNPSRPAGPLRILAVVGAAHLAGIRGILEGGERRDLSSLEDAPPPSYLRRSLAWLLPALFLFGLSALLFRPAADPLLLQRLLLAWVASRCIGAGVGTLIARARPLTILATVAIAPVSYFLGFLGIRLWMLSALVEARLKKPRVEDFEDVARDTENWSAFIKALYRNRVLHLFFVIWASSLGLTLGNLVFLKVFVDGLLSL